MKNKKVYGLVGVAALAAVGGTFAYYNASQTFTNPFKTTNYGSQATERFNPADGDKWEPGAEVNKDVYATNTGDGDVWVRVKFGEVWTLANGTTKSHFSNTEENGNVYNELFDIVKPDDAAENWVPSADTARQESDEDGATSEDEGTVVYKKYEAVVTNINDSTKGWFKGADGYYYYNVALAKGEQSGKLLDSVTLAKNADMGKFNFRGAYLVLPKGVIGENDDVPVYDPTNPTYTYKYTEGGEEKEGTATWQVIEEADKDKFPVLPPAKPVKGENESAEDYAGRVEEYKTAVAAYEAQYGKSDIYTYKEDVLDDDLQGYANADYNLNITVEFVQADKEAALAQGWNSTVVDELATKAAATE